VTDCFSAFATIPRKEDSRFSVAFTHSRTIIVVGGVIAQQEEKAAVPTTCPFHGFVVPYGLPSQATHRDLRGHLQLWAA